MAGARGRQRPPRHPAPQACARNEKGPKSRPDGRSCACSMRRGFHRVQPRHQGHGRRLRVRRGHHGAERGHLQLRPRQRGRSSPSTTGSPSRPPDGPVSRHGPVPPSAADRPRHRRGAGGGGQRARADLHDDGDLQLRPRRGRHAGAFAYWQLHVGPTWPTPVALVVLLGVLAPLLGVVIERVVIRLYDRRRVVELVVSMGLLFALIGIGLWVWHTDVASARRLGSWGNETVLRGRRQRHVVSDRDRHRHRAGDRAAAPPVPVPHRAADAGRGRRPPAGHPRGAAQRSSMLAWAIGVVRPRWRHPPRADRGRPVNLTLLIVNAFAAAMIGRLRSLPITFVGAVLWARRGHVLAYFLDRRAAGPVPFAIRSSSSSWPCWRCRRALRGPQRRDPRDDPAPAVARIAGHSRGMVVRPRWRGSSAMDHVGARPRRPAEDRRRRHHRPVARAARGVRWPGVTRPDELRRHRRRAHGPPRPGRQRHSRWRPRSPGRSASWSPCSRCGWRASTRR